MTVRGETKTVLAEVEGVKVIGHVWNDPGKPGKARKALIATHGSTIPADEARRPRKRKMADGSWETWYRIIPRTEIVKHYFQWAGAIDRANRQRMDDLRMEHTLEFKRWWLRVNTSFLAVIITDTINAWKFFEQPDIDFRSGVEMLVVQMINNNLRGCPDAEVGLDHEPGLTRQMWMNSTEAGVGRPGKVARTDLHANRASITPVHEIMPLRSLPDFKYRQNAKLTCRICKNIAATLYCVTCGRNQANQILALCNPATGRQCVPLHTQT